jgi:hypothetical protein
MATGDVVAVVTGAIPYTTTATATPDKRNMLPVWDFAASTDEFLYFLVRFETWDGSTGVTVKFLWTASTATAGDVDWEIAFGRCNGVDLDTIAFTAAQTGLSTANGTNGIPTEFTLNFTEAQIHAAGFNDGDVFVMRISRDANDVADDMVGDAELWDRSVVIVSQ